MPPSYSIPFKKSSRLTFSQLSKWISWFPRKPKLFCFTSALLKPYGCTWCLWIHLYTWSNFHTELLVGACISEIPVSIFFFITQVLFSVFVFKLFFVVTSHLTLSFIFLFFPFFFSPYAEDYYFRKTAGFRRHCITINWQLVADPH